ncbi:transposase [Croceimicrobium sp.]|uniref:transposase n=1 Tax=Croceimicrobium sp. TaxID=2828340 RepID=UPI003BAD9717
MSIRRSCHLLGFSRQAYYKPQALRRELVGLEDGLRSLILSARVACPGLGCRPIYYAHADQLSIGRDKFEALAAELGLQVKRNTRYIRTTKSDQRKFDNLLIDKQVRSINEVWQADMTYYLNGSKCYYLMFITDVYSQRILGYGAYSRANAVHFKEVLKQAIATRKKAGYTNLSGLIHHSDGGRQYEERSYREYCKGKGLKQSMCYYSWENPYAEKTNDLIKNRYLNYWKPTNLHELRLCLKQAVEHHNKFQQKRVLNNSTPIDFEWKIKSMESSPSSYTLNLKPSKPRTKNKKYKLVEISE